MYNYNKIYVSIIKYKFQWIIIIKIIFLYKLFDVQYTIYVLLYTISALICGPNSGDAGRSRSLISSACMASGYPR